MAGLAGNALAVRVLAVLVRAVLLRERGRVRGPLGLAFLGAVLEVGRRAAVALGDARVRRRGRAAGRVRERERVLAHLRFLALACRLREVDRRGPFVDGERRWRDGEGQQRGQDQRAHRAPFEPGVRVRRSSGAQVGG